MYIYIYDLTRLTNICIGFVDGHTHALWAGDRVSEFSLKVD